MEPHGQGEHGAVSHLPSNSGKLDAGRGNVDERDLEGGSWEAKFLSLSGLEVFEAQVV